MKLYWVTFVEPGIGCGVTAIDEHDCQRLVESNSFSAARSIESIIEITNFEEIDQNHVVPNMGDLLARGFWFPNGV